MKDQQQFFIISHYLRSISLFESACILAGKGLMAESRILSRSLLELTFILVAAVRDKDFVTEYVSSKDIEERKLRSQSLPFLREFLSAEMTEKIEAQLDEYEVKSKDTTKWEIWKIADLAELRCLYETDFRVLSGSTHIGSRDLDQYLVKNERGHLIGFQWGPSDDYLELSVSLPMHSMLLILDSVCRKYEIDESEEMARIKEKWLALQPSSRDSRRP